MIVSHEGRVRALAGGKIRLLAVKLLGRVPPTPTHQHEEPSPEKMRLMLGGTDTTRRCDAKKNLV